GDVGVAGRVHAHRVARVGVAAAEVGGVHHAAAGVVLGDEGVLGAGVGGGVGAGGHREVGRGGVAGDVHGPEAIDREGVGLVVAEPTQEVGVGQDGIDRQGEGRVGVVGLEGDGPVIVEDEAARDRGLAALGVGLGQGGGAQGEVAALGGDD